MIFDYANLTQLIAAKCGSMSAFAEQAGIDTAALDEYLGRCDTVAAGCKRSSCQSAGHSR